VVDAEALILSELEQLAPSHESTAPDWAAVLGRVNRRDRARWPSLTRLAATASIALVAVAVPALAFSAGVRSLLGFGTPRPVFTQSRLLVSGPVGNGFFAHLWKSPSSSGGTCAFATLDHQLGVPGYPTAFNGVMECSPQRLRLVPLSAEHPLSYTISVRSRPKSGDPRKWVPPTVSGQVYLLFHATRVQIEWRGGSHRLSLRGAYFVGGSPALYKPSFKNLPYYIVVYNSGGREVARQKLGSPTLELMSGWHEFTPKYIRWKTHQRP
jgi:hypothetical protein